MNSTSNNSPKSEVVTSIQRRRRWAPAQKKSIVMETYEPGMTLSYVARKHGIAPNQLFLWRRAMENGAMTAVGSEETVVPESELKKALARIRELERALGKSTMKVEILKEAVRVGREKKLISLKPLEGLEDFE